jgi:hypothetical protein
MGELSAIEIVAGVVGISGWLAVVLTGIVKIVLSARQKGEWGKIHVYGLLAMAALSSGIVLSIKSLLPHDTFGAGTVLAICGGIAIWGVAYSSKK